MALNDIKKINKKIIATAHKITTVPKMWQPTIVFLWVWLCETIVMNTLFFCHFIRKISNWFVELYLFFPKKKKWNKINAYLINWQLSKIKFMTKKMELYAEWIRVARVSELANTKIVPKNFQSRAWHTQMAWGAFLKGMKNRKFVKLEPDI